MAPEFDPYYKWLGIPRESQPPDHYRLLGIQTFEADPDVIQAAADQRMMHLRGYQTGKHSEWSQRLLNEVAAAKVCLLNAAKKAAYDQQLQDTLDDSPPAPPEPPPEPPPAQSLNLALSDAADTEPSRSRSASARLVLRSRNFPLGAIVVALATLTALLAVEIVTWMSEPPKSSAAPQSPIPAPPHGNGGMAANPLPHGGAKVKPDHKTGKQPDRPTSVLGNREPLDHHPAERPVPAVVESPSLSFDDDDTDSISDSSLNQDVGLPSHPSPQSGSTLPDTRAVPSRRPRRRRRR